MSTFDLTQIPAYFAIAGFVLWALVERWFHMSGQQQGGGEKKDRGSYWLISIAWYGAVILSIIDAFYLHWTPQDLGWLRWFGIPLVILGLAGRIMARRALGQQYSVRVETSERHQLITQGIYSKLRHPAYFGTLNLLMGIPLSLWSVIGLAIAVLAGIPAILYRIKIEEDALSERFGEAYREYAKNTWRIIPFLW